MRIGEDEAAVVQPTGGRGKHINKRALRNKALAVTFNEKELNDFVSGFHKRKKKRRKEARQKQEQAQRRKRIEDRKRRKLEREFAMYGGASAEAECEKDEEEGEEDVETESIPSVSGTMLYESGDVKVTVTTSEITREEEEKIKIPSIKPVADLPGGDGGMGKKNIPVSKKKSFKPPPKRKRRTKLLNKRDRRNGNQNAGKNRH